MKNILIILFVIFYSFSQSQDIKPSDIRKQKQIQDSENETKQESKLPSEKRIDKQINDDVFNENDSDFNVTVVPQKWDNKSVVVICQEYSFSILRKNNKCYQEEIIRKRIKLQDNAAVDEFSVFYYYTPYVPTDVYTNTYSGSVSFSNQNKLNKLANNIVIRIIKPSGEIQKVETDKAVETDQYIPYFFRPFYSSEDMTYMKLAIPNLSKGDIIDIYQKNSETKLLGIVEYDYPPFFFTLNSMYPIVKQKFSFKVDKGFYINFNSYNGAPDIVVNDESAKDANGLERNIIKTFEFTDTDRDNYEDNYYERILRSLPTVKFQVYYIPKGKENTSSYFIGKQGEVKKNVTPVEMNRIACNTLFSVPYPDYSKDILKFINENFNKSTPEEKLKEIFYEFRYLYLKLYYNTLTQQMSKFTTISDKNFISNLYIVLKKLNYNPDLLVCVPNYIGTIDEILLTEEMVTGLKINDNYFFAFNNYSNYNYIPNELAGTEALLISNPNVNQNNFKSERITIPTKEASGNTNMNKITLDLSNLQENISIKRETKLTGYTRENYYYATLYAKDYYAEDTKKYDINYKEIKETSATNAYSEEKKRKIKSLQEENIKQQKEYLGNSVKEDFTLTSYDDFSLQQNGRDDANPELIFTESFTVKDLLSKAGNNYIFQVGKLIGSQLAVEEKDSTRSIDIYQAYPRVIEKIVQITLPSNVTIDGMDALNMNVVNESCSFVSTAIKEGNILTIHTIKTFKKVYDENEKWINYYNVLKEAYSFTQKKIIININK